MPFMVSTSGLSRNSGRISLEKLNAIVSPPAAQSHSQTTLPTKLESKDGGELRSDVVRGETWHAAKQRQSSSTKIRAGAKVPLLVSERYPLVPFILNVAGEKIASSASASESAGIARGGLVIAV